MRASLASERAVVTRQRAWNPRPPPAPVEPVKPRRQPQTDTFEPQFLFEKSFDDAIVKQARALLMER